MGSLVTLSGQAPVHALRHQSCYSGPVHRFQDDPSEQTSFEEHPGFFGLTRTFLTLLLRLNCLSFQTFALAFGLSTWSFSSLFCLLQEEQFSLDID